MTYDLVNLHPARVTARHSANGSGSLPGPFAMSEAAIRLRPQSGVSPCAVDSSADLGPAAGLTSPTGAAAGSAPSSIASIAASSRAFVDP